MRPAITAGRLFFAFWEMGKPIILRMGLRNSVWYGRGGEGGELCHERQVRRRYRRFLEMMARTMELDLPSMSELGLHWKKEVAISSMCTVFAESEVVSLIADNTPTADIIHGLNQAVASKTASLVKRLGSAPAYVMTGGVAQNQGVVKALEEKLGEKIYVPKEAQLCGALGAALFALERG